MNELKISNLNDFVMLAGDKIVTDSRKVAEAFGKRHDNVLRAISKLGCSELFAKLNFEVCFENNELQNGKPLKFYRMTKDGFMLLVMGFSGKKPWQSKRLSSPPSTRWPTISARSLNPTSRPTLPSPQNSRRDGIPPACAGAALEPGGESNRGYSTVWNTSKTGFSRACC